jgi:hypothetical protein
MPIRTDRGRAVVYRRFWGWPLHSPRRLALTTLGAAATGIGIAVLTSLGAPRESQPAPAPTGAVMRPIPATGRASTPLRPPVSTPAQPGLAAVTSSPTAVIPPTANTIGASRDAAQTARAFAAQWVTHPPGTTGQQWAAQLAPFVVPEYLATLESVDPNTIPATAVTGDPTIRTTSAAVAEATVPTNAGALQLVLLTQPDGTWRVRSYDQATS